MAARKNVSVGPGAVTLTLRQGGEHLSISLQPNRYSAWNTITFSLIRRGTPISGARVKLALTMPDMAMTETFLLSETRPGLYCYYGPAIAMPGRWDLRFDVQLANGHHLNTTISDHVA
jgi:hypothetical protein